MEPSEAGGEGGAVLPGDSEVVNGELELEGTADDVESVALTIDAVVSSLAIMFNAADGH